MRRAWCFWAVMLAVLGLIAEQVQARCVYEVPSEAVSVWYDADEGRFFDAQGRAFRAGGVRLGGERAASWLNGRSFSAYAAGDADRWGRVPAVLWVSSTESLQERLVQLGLAQVYPEAGFKFCYAALLMREEEARQKELGLWQDEAVYSVEDDGLFTSVGEFRVVEGKVLSVGHTRSLIYLNFSQNWTDDFTGLIQRKSLPEFERNGLDVDTLAGRVVRMRGVIQLNNGPELLLRSGAQLEVLQTEPPQKR